MGYSSTERDLSIPALSLSSRLGLWVVFCPPLAWHAPMARLLGVSITPAEHLNQESLDGAERDSRWAIRFLVLQLAWGLFVIALAPLWVPALTAVGMGTVNLAFARVLPWAHALGFGRVQAADLAWAAGVLGLMLESCASLALFCVPVFYFGRRGVLAASSGVSVALSIASGEPCPELGSYPRLEFALGRLVKHR